MSKKYIKYIIISIIALAVVLAGSFFILKYKSKTPAKNNKAQENLAPQTQNPIPAPANPEPSAKSQKKENPQVEIPQNGIEVSGGNAAGLSICFDKCGDHVCEKSDPKCIDKNNPNCICPETKEECPQDCK